MTKQKLMTKVGLVQRLCRPKEEEKRKTWKHFQEPKTRRLKVKLSKQGQEQGDSRRLPSYLEFSSHIKGKSMNFGCFSIMFDASFACYDKL